MFDYTIIITAASVISSLVVICSALIAVIRWFQRQAEQDREIEQIKDEQAVLTYGVLACLKGLKRRGFRLGVISNWDASLENLLRNMGYLPYFDEVVASAAVGCRKPGSAIFEIALERMEVDASEAVHVGDLPEADGQGAASVGIRPIIIDRSGKHDHCEFERVSLLTDLVSLL